jgi:hypothetical protein
MTIPSSGFIPYMLTGIWGNSASDVFAVGAGLGPTGLDTILHYDGNTWSPMETPPSERGYRLMGVWGSSGSDVFAVGDDLSNFNATILHYNGSTWSSMELPDLGGIVGKMYVLQGVWGSSPTDVFTVGVTDSSEAVILHYNGNNWSAMSHPFSGVGYTVYSVWGSSGIDVFATAFVSSGGSNYHFIHYNGIAWSTMNSQFAAQGIWGSSGSDVFAVGAGTILHYGGTAPTTTTTIQGGTTTTTTSGTSTTTTTIQGGTTTTTYVTTTTTTKKQGPCPSEKIYGENSEQTQLLREYRDNVLSKTPEGQEVIKIYYKFSPAVTKLLEQRPLLKKRAKAIIDCMLPGIRKKVEESNIDR